MGTAYRRYDLRAHARTHTHLSCMRRLLANIPPQTSLCTELEIGNPGMGENEIGGMLSPQHAAII